jgi:hypothetical protein
MRLLYPTIEQLDLAAIQLRDVRPFSGRLSLILTDNAVELMLHNMCKAEIDWDEHWHATSGMKYSSAERRDALGTFFPPKVRLCRKIGFLTTDQGDFILACHGYRNELYHLGIRHDSIIHSLAWHYHDLACNLISRPGMHRMIMWPIGHKVPPAVKRHLGQKGLEGGKTLEVMLANVSLSLCGRKPRLAVPLPETLAASLVTRADMLQELLDFVVHDNPEGDDEKETIKLLQFWHCLSFSPQSKDLERYRAKRPSGATVFDAYRNRAQLNPPIKMNPLPKWRRRAMAIAKESVVAEALRKHERLKEEMSFFADAVERGAEALDRYIDEKIHEGR